MDKNQNNMTTREMDITNLAAEYGIDKRALKAVIDVESSGEGFFTDWEAKRRLKIQFEPHHFAAQAKKLGINVTSVKVGNIRILYYKGVIFLKNGVETQKPEWAAFTKAWSISPKAAMLATSWGMGQIMGFNFEAAGYKSVDEMVEAFKQSEYNQIKGMLEFIKFNGLLAFIKNKNWGGFAKGYNGSSYKDYNYDIRLAEAYARG